MGRHPFRAHSQLPHGVHHTTTYFHLRHLYLYLLQDDSVVLISLATLSQFRSQRLEYNNKTSRNARAGDISPKGIESSNIRAPPPGNDRHVGTQPALLEVHNLEKVMNSFLPRGPADSGLLPTRDESLGTNLENTAEEPVVCFRLSGSLAHLDILVNKKRVRNSAESDQG